MGAPVVMSVEPTELLCHRGTLIDDSGAQCEEWSQPARCVACCMTPFDGGLSSTQARAGRILRLLGPWSPYPKEFEFENRLDLLIGGLTWATTILVDDEAARDRLVKAGSPSRAIRVIADPLDAKALVQLYREANALWADSPSSAGAASPG